MLGWLFDRAKGFADPATLSDKDILSAITGQADWLEKQGRQAIERGGVEPYAELAEERRKYIARLCEALVARHPEPKNLMYHATKRAAQLQQTGKPRTEAVVLAVRQRLFEENGHMYMARWHPKTG